MSEDGDEAVWMEDRYKLFVDTRHISLFDISNDSAEKSDLSKALPEVAKRMKAELKEWKEGVMKELEIVTL